MFLVVLPGRKKKTRVILLTLQVPPFKHVPSAAQPFLKIEQSIPENPSAHSQVKLPGPVLKQVPPFLQGR